MPQSGARDSACRRMSVGGCDSGSRLRPRQPQKYSENLRSPFRFLQYHEKLKLVSEQQTGISRKPMAASGLSAGRNCRNAPGRLGSSGVRAAQLGWRCDFPPETRRGVVVDTALSPYRSLPVPSTKKPSVQRQPPGQNPLFPLRFFGAKNMAKDMDEHFQQFHRPHFPHQNQAPSFQLDSPLPGACGFALWKNGHLIQSNHAFQMFPSFPCSKRTAHGK